MYVMLYSNVGFGRRKHLPQLPAWGAFQTSIGKVGDMVVLGGGNGDWSLKLLQQLEFVGRHRGQAAVQRRKPRKLHSGSLESLAKY